MISQSSASTKRLRKEDADDLSLDTPTTSFVSCKSYENGNDKIINVKSNSRGKRAKPLTFNDYMKLHWPFLKILIKNDGAYISDWLYNYATPGVKCQNQRARFLPIQGGDQGWFTFVHLAKQNSLSAAVTTPTAYPAYLWQTTLSLDELMNKTKELVSGTESLTYDANEWYLNRSFRYYGGYCKHTFQNTCNKNLKLTFYISKPRKPLAETLNQVSHIKDNYPAGLSLRDKYTLRLTNNVASPQGDTTDIDATNDLCFNFSKYDKGLNMNYTYTAKTIMIPPGGTAHYTINFPPFHFNDSYWNELMRAGDTQPQLLPFCTQILDVRVQTQLAHGETNGTYDKVGYSPGQLIHTQEEYHNCRYTPATKMNKLCVLDFLNKVAGADLNINEEAEVEAGFNV